MYQLVYISEATAAFSPECLEELLTRARIKNKIKGLTGMLVFFDNQFLQVLEGNPADVIGMYDRLAEDPRHESLIVLHRGYSDVGKTFTGLSMGFHIMAMNEMPDGFASEDSRVNFCQFDGLMALEFLLACGRNRFSGRHWLVGAVRRVSSAKMKGSQP